MTVIEAEIRSGAYYDSVILMQLQRSLVQLPGILDAGVVMGTDANKDILAQSGLLSPEVQAAVADDMVIVVKGKDIVSAKAAIEKVDELLSARRGTGAARAGAGRPGRAADHVFDRPHNQAPCGQTLRPHHRGDRGRQTYQRFAQPRGARGVYAVSGR